MTAGINRDFEVVSATGSRNNFLKVLLAGACSGACFSKAAAVSQLPTRPLGMTGLSLPVIGMDTKSIAHGTEAKTQLSIEHAIAQGITFFDTSVDHMSGRSERRYGNTLGSKYRNRIFLQSRCMARTKAVLPKVLAVSLARLKTDYLDSFLMESVITGNGDGQIEIPAPDTFEGLLDARKAGKVRVVGIRSSADTSNLAKLLDLYGSAVDIVMIPKSLPESDRALLKARKLGIGIIADVDSAEQKRWKKSDQANILPEYISGWVLAMNNTADINAYCKRAMRLKEFK